jgi:protein-disulfide isomerase
MNQGAKSIMIGVAGILVGAAGAVLATGAASGAGEKVGTTDRAAIERIVREYILANPEILPEAMRNLERKEASAKVKAQGDKVEQPFGSAWEGAADGDVTLVEFYDYNCGYCRQALPDVDRLLAEDKKLKIVYRELPILSAESEAAARAALAVAKLGNHPKFHRAIYAAGRVTPETISAAIKATGLDEKQVQKLAQSQEVTDEIRSNLTMQQSLGMSGTPSWVVGNQLINGAVGYDELKAAIAEARAKAS